MIIKFLARGRGDPQKAKAYVLAEADHAGLQRAGVRVLRGDPDQVAGLASSLSFVHRYSSGVLAWHLEDRPTASQIDETLDEIERLMFSGLDPSRFCWTAVQHDEPDGGIHIHILIARVDLETGLSYNPAPPKWDRIYNPLQTALNYKHGWARPEDPLRARTSPAPEITIKKKKASQLTETERLLAEISKIKERDELHEKISKFALMGFSGGYINNRSELIDQLKGQFEVKRSGDDYISLVVDGKSVRLKGGVFTKDADYSQLDQNRQRTDLPKDEPDPEESAKSFQEHNIILEKRAIFNRKKYKQTKEITNVRNPRDDQKSSSKHISDAIIAESAATRTNIGRSRSNIESARAVSRAVEEEIRTSRSAAAVSRSVDDAIGRALQSVRAADDAHRTAGGPVSKCLQAVGRALERIGSALGRARREVMSRLDRPMASSKQVDRSSSHIPRPPRSPFERPKPKPGG